MRPGCRPRLAVLVSVEAMNRVNDARAVGNIGSPAPLMPGLANLVLAEPPSTYWRRLLRFMLQGMDRSTELRDFLRSRRARLEPPDVGLPWRIGTRRIVGLRREELALAAGVSVDYYTRLEQGRAKNVSDQVLHALADALRLDDLERAHLHNLARPADGRSRDPQARLRPARRGRLVHSPQRRGDGNMGSRSRAMVARLGRRSDRYTRPRGPRVRNRGRLVSF